MRRKGLICMLFTLFSIVMYAQQGATAVGTVEEVSQIEWLSFEEVEKKMEVQKKKMIINIYQAGCGWCAKMDKETFQEPSVIEYINREFYAVKLNAEHQEIIDFQGQAYGFVKTGTDNYHELVVKITRGEKSTPSVVFLDEGLDVIQSLSGYKDALNLEKLMSYFAENHHKNTPWVRYEAQYDLKNKLNTSNAEAN